MSDDSSARHGRAEKLRAQIRELARGKKPTPKSPRDFTEPRSPSPKVPKPKR